MSETGWRTRRAKRNREAQGGNNDTLLENLIQKEGVSELRMYREAAPGYTDAVQAYPFRFGGDPFPYYRYSPHYFGAQPAGQPSSGNLQAQNDVKGNKTSTKTAVNKTSQKKLPNRTHAQAPTDGTYPSGYGYYPYPYPYAYPYPYPYPTQYQPQQPQPYPGHSYPLQPYPYPYSQANQGPPSEESGDGDQTAITQKSGMMSIEGRRPLFLVALFVVSIAVLLVSFPLTLLSAGYIGPLGLMFATGPFATVFAFWAIYLTPCECYPNIDWAVSRIRMFATTAAVFDGVGMIGVPISMYGAQCPDDDDQMLGCEDELPAAKGISMAVAVVLGTHLFLCILVRSNARKLAESKFGDERTEGITLTPTPLRR